MPIERRLLFENGTAYDLVATKLYILRLYQQDDPAFPQHRMAHIWKALDDMQYVDIIHDFIEEPYTGVLCPLDVWMHEYGCVDHTLAMLDDGNDDATIGTFDSENLHIEGNNDVIDLTEEGNLVDTTRLLSEIRDDVIDLTEMDEECIEQDPEDMFLGWYLHNDTE